MKKVDLKIEKLCNKLEHIVKYTNDIIVIKSWNLWGDDIYTISSNDLRGDIFSIISLADNHGYSIRVDYDTSLDSSDIHIGEDNENAKKLMQLVKDKYENQKDEKKIKKIDKSLEILDKINDLIIKKTLKKD